MHSQVVCHPAYIVSQLLSDEAGQILSFQLLNTSDSVDFTVFSIAPDQPSTLQKKSFMSFLEFKVSSPALSP